MKGKLITLYGVNNMGKTSKSRFLVEKLKSEGFEAEYVKYPVYDLEPSGPFINGVLRGGVQRISEREFQLWCIVNRHQHQESLREKLESGVYVVAEDYVGTGIAWGMTKGLDREWLEVANEGLIKEDLAVFMDGKRVMKSKEDGHVHEQDDELVQRCYENFKVLCEDYGWRKVQLQDDWKETERLLWDVVRDIL